MAKAGWLGPGGEVTFRGTSFNAVVVRATIRMGYGKLGDPLSHAILRLPAYHAPSSVAETGTSHVTKEQVTNRTGVESRVQGPE